MSSKCQSQNVRGVTSLNFFFSVVITCTSILFFLLIRQASGVGNDSSLTFRVRPYAQQSRTHCNIIK